MSEDVFKLKRGTTAQVDAYLPAQGEPVYNITTKALTIGDGLTMGGVNPSLSNGNLAAVAALTGSADTGFYFTGASAMSLYTLSALGRTLGGIANQAAGRAAIGAAASGPNTDITSITGSAATLTTARTISATGDGTWSVSFNGSANVTSALTLSTTGVSAGSYERVTVDTKGRVTSGVSPTTFTNLSLLNSWTVVAGRRAGYRKVLDMVYLEIQITGGTATDGTQLAILPAGFRPPNTVNLPVISGPNTTPSSTVNGPRVTVGTDGVISCVNCSSVTGIVFTAMISTI